MQKNKDVSLILFSSENYLTKFFGEYRLKKIGFDDIALLNEGGIYLVDFDNILLSTFKFGNVSAQCGKAAGEYISRAVDLLLKKSADAMVTAPINKEAFNRAGYHYPGHTEFLADLSGGDAPVMLMYSETFSVALVTIHIPLSDVAARLSIQKEFEVITKTDNFFKKHIKQSRIAVCGLNPHSSENGIFGDEEEQYIAPAVRKAQSRGIRVDGPFPADTLFYYAKQGKYDVVIAQYHDQGLIPFKLLHFNDGVNVTAGLPIIRTSPDHGTAFDIAGKNKADELSMLFSINAAYRFVQNG